MIKTKLKRIVRAATPEEKQRHRAIREKIAEEFPPVNTACSASGKSKK